METSQYIDLSAGMLSGKFYIGFSAVGGVHQTGRMLEPVNDAVFLAEVETLHGEVDHFFRVVHFQEFLQWRFYADAQTRDNAVALITAAYEKRVAEELAKQAAAAEQAKQGDNPDLSIQ